METLSLQGLIVVSYRYLVFHKFNTNPIAWGITIYYELLGEIGQFKDRIQGYNSLKFIESFLARLVEVNELFF